MRQTLRLLYIETGNNFDTNVISDWNCGSYELVMRHLNLRFFSIILMGGFFQFSG